VETGEVMCLAGYLARGELAPQDFLARVEQVVDGGSHRPNPSHLRLLPRADEEQGS